MFLGVVVCGSRGAKRGEKGTKVQERKYTEMGAEF